MTAAIPIAAQIECVERELKMRRRVYPRFVTEGRMSQAKADHELAAMEAVLETLKEIGAEQAVLFDDGGEG